VLTIRRALLRGRINEIRQETWPHIPSIKGKDFLLQSRVSRGHLVASTYVSNFVSDSHPPNAIQVSTHHGPTALCMAPNRLTLPWNPVSGLRHTLHHSTFYLFACTLLTYSRQTSSKLRTKVSCPILAARVESTPCYPVR
jgi:hypothetical protein